MKLSDLDRQIERAARRAFDAAHLNPAIALMAIGEAHTLIAMREARSAPAPALPALRRLLTELSGAIGDRLGSAIDPDIPEARRAGAWDLWIERNSQIQARAREVVAPRAPASLRLC